VTRTPAATVEDGTWCGRWVADHLGVTVGTGSSPLGVAVGDLVGLALRHNPRRAHLLVSGVIGKHVPADPRLIYGTGLILGGLVRAALREPPEPPGPPAGQVEQFRAALAAERPHSDAAVADLPGAVLRGLAGPVPRAVVLGYAETATALGHAVADACGTAVCLHSTRRRVPGVEAVGGFVEEHSHATSHLLLPADHTDLLNDLPLVLVDDELSTGTTVINTVEALHRLHPRARYLVATLVDARRDADRVRMAAAAAALSTTIDVVALSTGQVRLPPDAPARARELAAGLVQPDPGAVRRVSGARGRVRRVDIGWPATLTETGRHGFTPAHRRRLEESLPSFVDRLVAALPADGRRLHVLGVEEFMYVPLRIAVGLAGRLAPSAVEVTFSSTTRSPVLTLDHPGYAVRRRLTFAAHDGAHDGAASAAPGDGLRHAYNLDVSAGTVLLVLDRAADTAALSGAGGLLDALTTVADLVLVSTVGQTA
jgi:adenine/guanine phosphoribosyltransferase-like PRPP-binding protein